MTVSGALGAGLVAGAALLTSFFSFPARAQTAPGSYEVKKGEGLYAIGGRLRYEGATRFQIIIGIYRANQEAFPDGNINVLRENQVLTLPSPEQVAAITPAEASRQWRTLTARPAPQPAPVAAVKAATTAVKPPKAAVALPPGREELVRRYRVGLALERKGDDQGALRAFLEAGEAGYGLAQRKLGQIYDKGNSAVQRDYQTSLHWYQKAREQGVEIDKPLQRMTTK